MTLEQWVIILGAIGSLVTAVAVALVQLGKLRGEVAQMKAAANQTNANAKKTEAEAEQIEAETDELRVITTEKLIERLNAATLAANEAEMRLAHERRQATEREGKLLENIYELNKRISNLETSSRVEIANLKTENRALHREREEARAENRVLHEKLDIAQAELSDLRAKYDELQGEVQKLKAKTGPYSQPG